jgi:hypothetical protein
MRYVRSTDHTAVEARGIRPHKEERARTPEHIAHEHNSPKAHTEHDKEQAVQLGEAERKECNIEVGTVGSGKLQMHLTLPGAVALNADRRAHVVPRISGVVRRFSPLTVCWRPHPVCLGSRSARGRMHRYGGEAPARSGTCPLSHALLATGRGGTVSRVNGQGTQGVSIPGREHSRMKNRVVKEGIGV